MSPIRTAAMAIATLAAPAIAGGPLAVASSILVERHVAAADGTTRIVLVRAAHVAPGDRVVVALDYRNTGGAPITGLVLGNPVPRGLVYRGPASGSPAPELSIDGQHFAAVLPAGALAASVTAVRWRLSAPLAAGGSGQLAFAATLK